MGLTRKGMSNGRSYKYNQMFAKAGLNNCFPWNVLNRFIVYHLD